MRGPKQPLSQRVIYPIGEQEAVIAWLLVATVLGVLYIAGVAPIASFITALLWPVAVAAVVIIGRITKEMLS